jgi:hypothetical protein
MNALLRYLMLMLKSISRLTLPSAALLILIFATINDCRAESGSAEKLPDYMSVIVGNGSPMTKAEAAEQSVLGLDIAMFGIYDDAQRKFQKNFLAQHPVIMGLFSNQGGTLTLFRPGKEPVYAPPVPIRYQLYKSIGHSALAIFELAGAHLGTVSDQSWEVSMRGFRAANQSALDGLDAVDLSPEARENQRNVLKSNLKFMDACLSKGTYSFADIQNYSTEVKPYLLTNITWGATTQVEHWMEVLKGWKETLGPEWDKTYGVSNTLYVARQNNVIFSTMAQFFGKQAMNTRLFLFETSAFITTPAQMFDVLIRTVADRSVGEVFFGNYYLMDYELMGGDGRKAIAATDKKYGMPVFLPPAVPFHSNEWPFRIDPAQGEGPATIEQIK